MPGRSKGRKKKAAVASGSSPGGTTPQGTLLTRVESIGISDIPAGPPAAALPPAAAAAHAVPAAAVGGGGEGLSILTRLRMAGVGEATLRHAEEHPLYVAETKAVVAQQHQQHQQGVPAAAFAPPPCAPAAAPAPLLVQQFAPGMTAASVATRAAATAGNERALAEQLRLLQEQNIALAKQLGIQPPSPPCVAAPPPPAAPAAREGGSLPPARVTPPAVIATAAAPGAGGARALTPPAVAPGPRVVRVTTATVPAFSSVFVPQPGAAAPLTSANSATVSVPVAAPRAAGSGLRA